MDTLKRKGIYNFKIRDVNGNIRDEWTVNNIITNAGLAQLALLTYDPSATPFTYIAVGSGTTAVAASQTALATEITTSGLARASATITRTTTTVTDDTTSYSYEWTLSGTATVEEIGIFNASSAGTMLSRALTGSKPLLSGEKFEATYTIVNS